MPAREYRWRHLALLISLVGRPVGLNIVHGNRSTLARLIISPAKAQVALEKLDCNC